MIRKIRRYIWKQYIIWVHRNNPYCDVCNANHYFMDIKDPDYLDCWVYLRAIELNEDRLDRVGKVDKNYIQSILALSTIVMIYSEFPVVHQKMEPEDCRNQPISYIAKPNLPI